MNAEGKDAEVDFGVRGELAQRPVKMAVIGAGGGGDADAAAAFSRFVHKERLIGRSGWCGAEKAQSRPRSGCNREPASAGGPARQIDRGHREQRGGWRGRLRAA